MQTYFHRIIRDLSDESGQDMVEYALLAGFIAVAAGATLPGIADSVSTIFSKMASVTTAAAQAGSPGSNM